jgi:hypothetical protein
MLRAALLASCAAKAWGGITGTSMTSSLYVVLLLCMLALLPAFRVRLQFSPACIMMAILC